MSKKKGDDSSVSYHPFFVQKLADYVENLRVMQKRLEKWDKW